MDTQALSYPVDYNSSIAELSEEELFEITAIVTKNGLLMEKSALETLVCKELPLCHPGDISQAITNCMLSNSMFSNNVRRPTKAKTSNSDQVQFLNTQSISIERNKRWEKNETQRLLEYVTNVNGRINWFACSRFVGTKTSDQCKSRYNNLKSKIPL